MNEITFTYVKRSEISNSQDQFSILGICHSDRVFCLGRDSDGMVSERPFRY